MTDKYEEFKEWFTTKKFKAKKEYTWYDAPVLFNEFEEDYKEKHYKDEIINLINQTLMANVTCIEYYSNPTHPAQAIYEALKEKDIIK